MKVKTERNRPYLDFIRSMPCLVCGGPSEAHHEPLNGHGVGIKGPDTETLPLCGRHHRERHDMGRFSFYEAIGVDWREKVERYQKLYERRRQA